MSFWKKLFGGGANSAGVAPAASQRGSSASGSPAEKASCRHSWDGCTCTKCGEVRMEDGEYKNLIRTDWHSWKNNECTKCGRKRRAMTVEYR